jgi:hypothetical protein
MADGVVHTVPGCLCVCQCFIADKEIEVLHAPLRRKVSWFRWNGRGTGRLARRSTRRDRSGKYTSLRRKVKR